MPGEMVTLLLGAQGGDEESFACLYAVTNPVLVRYLRVVSDADPAPLSVATWSTLLDGLSGCVADDDDDWLALAVGTARETALASAAGGATTAPAPDGTVAQHGTGPGPDPVDAGVAMLRACGPAVADVLAMGVVAGLGRDSIARITGQQPTEVLALVHEGEVSLGLPLETLIATMQVPGSPAEVSDLPAVLPLFAAQSHAALAAGAAGAASAAAAVAASTGSSTTPKLATVLAASAATTAAATAATPAAATTPAASAGGSGVADLLAWGHADPDKSSFVVLPTPQPSRWTSIGASAAAWTIAVGGLGAAAAMSGVIPAAIDGLFGNDGNRPVVVAQGPVRPGETPSPDGGPVTTPRPSDGQPGSQGPSEPGTGDGGTSADGGGGAVAVSAGFGTATGAAVVVPAVVTSPPSGPSTPTTPGPGAQPPTSTPPPPTTGGGTSSGAGKVKVKGAGHAYAYGKSRPKHSTGNAKGHAKTATAAKAKPVAKSQAKSAAAKAKAKAAAKAAKAAAKAAAAKAKSAKSRA